LLLVARVVCVDVSSLKKGILDMCGMCLLFVEQ